MKVKKYLMILLITCLISLSCLTVASAIDSNATNFNELQQDIENNDVIELTQDIKRVDSESRIIINKTVTIDGKGHTIDGNHNGRIFSILSNYSTVTLINIKIINGYSNCDNGGAIENYGNMNIINCTFKNNEADWYGGAIFNTYIGNMNIINSTFINNQAKYGGGAIADRGDLNSNDRGNLYIINSTFINNQAKYAGAIHGYTFSCINSYFENNQVNEHGGAIIATDLTIKNCVFEKNNAKQCGGAIYTNTLDKCINCTFSNNKAEEYGGAIYINNKCTSLIQDCVFEKNTAEKGGALYMDSKKHHVKIIHNVFKDNYSKKDSSDNVYEMGYYDQIQNNYFPNGKNQFLEHKSIGPNIIHTDSNPSTSFDNYDNGVINLKQNIVFNVLQNTVDVTKNIVSNITPLVKNTISKLPFALNKVLKI